MEPDEIGFDDGRTNRTRFEEPVSEIDISADRTSKLQNKKGVTLKENANNKTQDRGSSEYSWQQPIQSPLNISNP